MSTKAKRRQEKGLDRAEAVIDKKERKIEKSKGRARTVQERAKAWDDLNKKILAKQAREDALEKENAVDEEDEEDDEEVMDADVEAPHMITHDASIVGETTSSVPHSELGLVEDDDEIL